MNEVFDRIATEASRLSGLNKRSIISSKEVETAVKNMLSNEHAKGAISKGKKAMEKIMNRE